jgi:hypothetical protein
MSASRHTWRPSGAALASATLAASALLSLWCVAGALTARARETETRDFSADEQARLRAGQLVVRSEQVTKGTAHLIGGLSWQVVDASVEEVWRAMANVAAYPKFLPAVSEARVVETMSPAGASSTRQRLFVRHETPFLDTSYYVLTRTDPATHTFAFRLDRTRPAAMTDAWGELRVSPYESGKSVVSLAIMADLGPGLVARLVRSQVHEWMLRIPEQLQHYVAREKRRRS